MTMMIDHWSFRVPFLQTKPWFLLGKLQYSYQSVWDNGTLTDPSSRKTRPITLSSYGDPRSHRFLAPILCPMQMVGFQTGLVPPRSHLKRLFGCTLSDGKKNRSTNNEHIPCIKLGLYKPSKIIQTFKINYQVYNLLHSSSLVLSAIGTAGLQVFKALPSHVPGPLKLGLSFRNLRGVVKTLSHSWLPDGDSPSHMVIIPSSYY